MDITGILTKRGTRIKTWHRRFFVLHNNTLSYYVYDGGPLKGEYILTADTKVESARLRRYCFCLTQKDGRTLYMNADNIIDQEMWMTGLDRAISRIRSQAAYMDPSSPSIELPGMTSKDTNNIKKKTSMLCEVHIKVVQARNLTAKGSMDTYARVSLDCDTHTTKVIKKELNPVWEEEFCFVWSPELRYARVDVWDADPMLSARDSFLGVVYIPILPLRHGNRVAKWYNLGKRSSRSHVTGEIKISAFCDKERDQNAWKILEELQAIAEVKTEAKNPYIPLTSDKVQVENSTGNHDSTGTESSGNERSSDSLLGLAGRFPTRFPPLETEELEDISLMVSLKPYDKGGSSIIYSDGVLLLTNYRLIFVAHSLVAFANEYHSDMHGSAELTTLVPLASIVSIDLKQEPDPHPTSGSTMLDAITIKTNDSRIFSFLFYGANDSRAMQMFSGLGASKSRLAQPQSVDSPSTFQRRGSFNIGRGMFAKPSRRGNRSQSVDVPWKESGPASLRKDSTSSTRGGEELMYLEAHKSKEGPPSQRMFLRVQWRVINRTCEVYELQNIHSELMDIVKRGIDGPDAIKEGRASTIDSTLDEYLSGAESFSRPASGSAVDVDTVAADVAPPTVQGLRVWMRSIPESIRRPLCLEITSGWRLYDPVQEYARLGIPDALWRLTTCNSSYSVCPTYPAVLCVPAAVDDTRVELASTFRSRGRFPVLSWRHPTNYCTLTRSSQPLVGLGQNRSIDDELLIAAINQAGAYTGTGKGETLNMTNNQRILPGTRTKQIHTNELGEVIHPLVIVDARPKINAQANQAVGKGYEMGRAYEDCKIIFMGIANIHVMRKSIDAMEEACCSSSADDVNWMKNLDKSGWLLHISTVLTSAARVVHCIAKEEYSVLVHCSDGWDRTAQLTSLSMLMMDPYYRTFDGFQILVEKEWFSFGHKFKDRLGWSDEGWGDSERSPVFHQFLDCVHQCLRQKPSIFEFNENLLLFLATHTLSGWFGNVFANCEAERLPLKENTVSMWTFVNLNRNEYLNDTYTPLNDIWVPNASARNIVVWNGWFLKWHNTVWEMGWQRRNEDFSDLPDTPSTWMKDSAVLQCCGCDRPFNFVRRRHHCRACGQIFCEACVKNLRIVRAVSDLPVRVCDTCELQLYEGVDEGKGDKNDSTLDSSAMSKLFGMKSQTKPFAIGSEQYALKGNYGRASQEARESSVADTVTTTSSMFGRMGNFIRSKSSGNVFSSRPTNTTSGDYSSVTTIVTKADRESIDERAEPESLTERPTIYPSGDAPLDRPPSPQLRNSQSIVSHRPFASPRGDETGLRRVSSARSVQFENRENNPEMPRARSLSPPSQRHGHRHRSRSEDKYRKSARESGRESRHHRESNGGRERSKSRSRSRSPSTCNGSEHSRSRSSSRSPTRSRSPTSSVPYRPEVLQRVHSNRFDQYKPTKPVVAAMSGSRMRKK